MGKRSDFVRVKGDFYVTPYEAVIPLIPHLNNISYYSEPCAGDGALIDHLFRFGKTCLRATDVDPRQRDGSLVSIDKEDALHLCGCSGQAFITNPPWTREILHPLIIHLSNKAPTWLLFDADWMHTKQAVPYLDFCMKIVSVGRVKWIPGSKNTGKDNAAWYLFSAAHQGSPKFFGRGLTS